MNKLMLIQVAIVTFACGGSIMAIPIETRQLKFVSIDGEPLKIHIVDGDNKASRIMLGDNLVTETTGPVSRAAKVGKDSVFIKDLVIQTASERRMGNKVMPTKLTIITTKITPAEVKVVNDMLIKGTKPGIGQGLPRVLVFKQGGKYVIAPAPSA